MFFNAFLALSLRTLLVWENKQLDKKYGTSKPAGKTDEGVNHGMNVGEENYGTSFRYIL